MKDKSHNGESYFDNIEWVNDNTLKVYRNITILENELEEYLDNPPVNIGEYWTLSKALDSAVWGYGYDDDKDRIEIRCEGELNLEDINWERMLYAYNDEIYHFVSEKEIRGDIKIIKCYK